VEKRWVKFEISTSPDGVEYLSTALIDLGFHSFSVVDASDIDKLMDGKYGTWDYIDPKLEKQRVGKTTITLYLPHDDSLDGQIAKIRDMLERLKLTDTEGILGSLEYVTSYINDENWADKWKEGFEPIIIGEKLIVCPTWLDSDRSGRITIKIDPGMAFGTGHDETTRLCLEALEKYVSEGCTVLDIGCGSGILSIAALLLGAESAFGVDIDAVAVNTARENAGLNGVSEKSEFICGSLSCLSTGERFSFVQETFDIVCANISAKEILAMMPDFLNLLGNSGILILSGIAKNREQEVIDSLHAIGLFLLERKEENNWVCIAAN